MIPDIVDEPTTRPVESESGARKRLYLQLIAGIGFLLAAAFRVSDMSDPSADWKDYAATIGWTVAGVVALVSVAVDHRRSR